MKFDNRIAIVTGAADGIGRATALRLAEEGVKVAVLDLAQDKVDKVAEEIRMAGGQALPLTVDICQSDAVKIAVDKVIDTFGKIDILINCAGIGWQRQPYFKDMVEDEWKRILDVNIHGTMLFTHAVLDHMIEKKYGRIINITSIAGKVGIPKLAVYSASKGAILSFTKALAMELGPHEITVNAVSPGLVAHSEEHKPSNGTFLERWGRPTEVAATIAFLASDETSFVTGADHLVDGGRTLGPRGA